MPTVGRVRARALTLCAGGLCVAALAGCTSTGGTSGVTASGSTLTVYISMAPGGGSAAQRDVADAEQLAFQQSGTQPIGNFKLRLASLNGAKLSDNARTAIQNTGAIAYLGELAPGSSAQTLGITNAQDVLQVSPTDTAVELTQSTPAISNTPDRYYESLGTYGRTFARVVPTTAIEAKAQLQEMQALHVSRLYVTGDGSQYGDALAAAIRGSASSSGITVAASAAGADALFYAGAQQQAAAKAFTSAAASNPAIKLFGPSALDQASFGALVGAGARNVYISSPGFLPGDLNAAGQQFVTQFKAAYGHAPATEAIFGYEAMKAVLDVLRESGKSANDRGTVVKNFFAIHNRPSVLGTYSINSDGDTSLGSFVFSRLRAGVLVPFTSVQVQG